jgi:hypothetical protein
MATVIDKQVDSSQGAVFLRVKDAVLGNETNHTIYFAGPSGVADINAAIAQIQLDADANAKILHDRMTANGLI